MTNPDIIQTCESKINIGLLTARTHALCVDGTSATRKSSMLAATSMPVRKVQWFAHTINANTYFPSTIGYIASGLMNQNAGMPHFNDRSYLNTLEWRVLWKIMDDYYARFGNVYPDDTRADIRSALDSYRAVFDHLRSAYFYKTFREMMNGIAIIDSNIERCDLLRQSRAEGSDRERSSWRFYTFLQNLMYTRLYPSLYVDVAWFDDSEIETVTESIAVWLTSVLSRLGQTVGFNARSPLIEYKLPVPKHDFCLSNMTTHSYRSLGRLACKSLHGDVPALDNYIPPPFDVYDDPANKSVFLDSFALTRPSRATQLIEATSSPVLRASANIPSADCGGDTDHPETVTYADAFDEDDCCEPDCKIARKDSTIE